MISRHRDFRVVAGHLLLMTSEKLNEYERLFEEAEGGGDSEHARFMLWMDEHRHEIRAALADHARLEWLESLTKQAAWRVTRAPRQQHEVALQSGHNHAFASIRAAIDAGRFLSA